MAVTIYRSTDAGAPSILPGTINGIADLLEACLVNGYGLKPGQGWTKAFVSTSGGITVFKQPLGSSGCFLQVDEERTARGCYMRMYETMSNETTGTGPFPRLVDDSRGYMLPKGSFDNTPLKWNLFTNGTAVWLFVTPRSNQLAYSNPPFNYTSSIFFGDIVSYKPGDVYKCVMWGDPYDQNLYQATDPYTSSPMWSSEPSLTQVVASKTIQRSTFGTPGAVRFGIHTPSFLNSITLNGANTEHTFPNASDGGLYITRLEFHESSPACLRGIIPGAYCINHNWNQFQIGDTFSGVGEMAGKTFEFVSAHNGTIVIETSNTW